MVNVKKIIAGPVASILRKLRLKKLLPHSYGKKLTELAFQVNWSKEFKDNKDKVLEYWEKYRYLNEIRAICSFDKDAKILDVGCGISTVLHFIDGQRYGIDPLAEEYRKLYRYPADVTIQKSYGECIPFADEFFDVVFCSNVLDHVVHPAKTLDEIYRVCKKDGYFVLTVEIFTEKKQRDPAHPHSLTKEDVDLLLEERAFEKIFERQSPWIGLKNYVQGSRGQQNQNNELVLILKKTKPAPCM